MGITYANNRFYVVDQGTWNRQGDEKVYAYTSLGQRDSSSDFDLDSNNSNPRCITYANNRFYVLGWRKVYAYTSLGQRDSSSDFDLDTNNGDPSGITYANNRFYVVDWRDDKVYAYTSLGQRDSSSDFNLDSTAGITYANNRFYVLGWIKVYAYTSLGQRDSSSDFNLDTNNIRPEAITYANNHSMWLMGERFMRTRVRVSVIRLQTSIWIPTIVVRRILRMRTTDSMWLISGIKTFMRTRV